jgi:hypothetical protein
LKTEKYLKNGQKLKKIGAEGVHKLFMMNSTSLQEGENGEREKRWLFSERFMTTD